MIIATYRLPVSLDQADASFVNVQNVGLLSAVRRLKEEGDRTNVHLRFRVELLVLSASFRRARNCLDWYDCLIEGCVALASLHTGALREQRCCCHFSFGLT